MIVKELKQRLHAYGFKVKHSFHHSWIIYIERTYPHSKLSRDVNCVEISTRYQSYWVNKPQLISVPVLRYINTFASTPIQKRKDYYAPQHLFVLCSRAKGYRIQNWYMRHGKVHSQIGDNVQQFINNQFFLTKTQLMKIESYLLAHGIVKKSLTILPIIKEK